jgi:hypothetical protein
MTKYHAGSMALYRGGPKALMSGRQKSIRIASARNHYGNAKWRVRTRVNGSSDIGRSVAYGRRRNMQGTMANAGPAKRGRFGGDHKGYTVPSPKKHTHVLAKITKPGMTTIRGMSRNKKIALGVGAVALGVGAAYGAHKAIQWHRGRQATKASGGHMSRSQAASVAAKARWSGRRR